MGLFKDYFAARAGEETLAAGDTFLVRQDATGDVVEISQADLEAQVAASTAMSSNYAPLKFYIGDTEPTPDAGEFIWFQTDGAGNLVDILTGIGS